MPATLNGATSLYTLDEAMAVLARDRAETKRLLRLHNVQTFRRFTGVADGPARVKSPAWGFTNPFKATVANMVQRRDYYLKSAVDAIVPTLT